MRARALGIGLALAAVAAATTIDPLTFEELVRDAHFIGIVECEVAGAVVARYRVIESWKGPEAGTKLTILVPPDPMGYTPITLVGERYVVTAFRGDAPSRMMSTTMGGPNPIWWREFPAGHALPLYQGRAPLPPRKERSFGDLGSERTKLEDLRKDVTDFLRLEPGARERRVLRALAEKELRRHMKGDLPELLKKLDAADDTAALAGELARMVSKGNAPEDHERAWALGAIFAKGGEAVTLAVLEKEQPGPAEWREEVLREVRARLKPGAAQVESEKPEEPPPATAEKLKEMRTWLQGKPTEEQIGELMWFLTAQDPGPLAEWLARWEPEADGPFGSDQGYGMASWFAWKCGSDRGANLKKLLAAKDPCVRVAGAVYLCYEDEAAGREALRACMKLEGDAGSWAALTLARRGDKDAMPRLFQALEPPQERRSGLLRGNLIQATQLLLSNVASAGGLPQAPALGPEVPGPQHAGDFERAERERADRFRKLREACEAWWKEHGAKAKLADPWLPLCAEKKID